MKRDPPFFIGTIFFLTMAYEAATTMAMVNFPSLQSSVIVEILGEGRKRR